MWSLRGVKVGGLGRRLQRFAFVRNIARDARPPLSGLAADYNASRYGGRGRRLQRFAFYGTAGVAADYDASRYVSVF